MSQDSSAALAANFAPQQRTALRQLPVRTFTAGYGRAAVRTFTVSVNHLAARLPAHSSFDAALRAMDRHGAQGRIEVAP